MVGTLRLNSQPRSEKAHVDERGPSLVTFLQNLSEGLAPPQTIDVSDKFTA